MQNMTFVMIYSNPKIIFVNAGSKKILYLLIQKHYRLQKLFKIDGFNDLKKMKNNGFKIKTYLSNLSMNFAKKIFGKQLFSSLFVKERWEKKYGISDKNSYM